ncbi:MAG TPA: Zn-ribbon domain-containing OB-fold protein [Candidatus Binatia bacterium]|nr:Zn-ribbon domain-containing OB-fold protein [Candidatus Binatia bacterium]
MGESQREIQKPLPEITPVNKPFWDAAKAGKLMMQKCQNCGTWVFCPRPVCGECASDKLEWVEVSQKGKIFAFTIIREVVGTALAGFAPDIPYVTAWVDLEDGPRICSNVIGSPIDQIKIDMPVEVVFEDAGAGVTLPKFRPLNV